MAQDAQQGVGGTAGARLDLTGILERTLGGQPLSTEEGTRLAEGPPEELPALLEAAEEMRDRGHGRRVSFSRNVFLPLTNLCRNRCAYCSFRREPDQPGQHTMTFEEVRHECRRAFRAGCTEALFCLGDRPESLWPSHQETLRQLGVDCTAEQVAVACRIALEEGLLPHTNAGALTREELTLLKRCNVSMGLMLESASPRLAGKGMPHEASPDKAPGVRLRVLRDAVDLRIPFTSGILLGIGETPRERVEALVLLRDLHLQEVIVQNFRHQPGLLIPGDAEPDAEEVARTVAVARLLLGPEVNLQAPPNLNPGGHRLLLRAGINDWGGLSPLTRDYINPQAPWPHAEALAQTCAEEGYVLAERLAIYPEFVEEPGYLDGGLLNTVRERSRELGVKP